MAVIKIDFAFLSFHIAKMFPRISEQERKPVASLMLMFTCSWHHCVSKSGMQILLPTVILWLWLAKYEFPHLELFVLWEIKL